MGYYKKQILQCEKYIRYRDLLSAMLEDDVKYSFEEVDEKIAWYNGSKGEEVEG